MYKRSFYSVLFRCNTREEGYFLKKKAHSSIYGGHVNSNMLAKKILRQGYYYYWPTNNGGGLLECCDKIHEMPKQNGPKQRHSLRSSTVVKFIMKNIITQFEVPKILVTDNEPLLLSA